MTNEKDKAIEKREQKIDESLKETFPASDTPTFVGGFVPHGIVEDERGQDQPADKKRAIDPDQLKKK